MSELESIEEYLESLRTLPVGRLEWMAAHIDKERFHDRYKAIIDAISERKLHPGNEENDTRKIIRYAGFWVRLGANLVDLLILMPFIFLYYYLKSISWQIAVIFQTPFFLSFSLYNIYFLGRWGQTLGKMALRIKVTCLDGSPIGFRRAVLRHAVDLFFGVLLQISGMMALLSVSETAVEMSGWREMNKFLYDATPVWGFWASHAESGWYFSEMVVLLFNKKKRAIHDFIAGTLVIKTNK
jgi:uncharacterized RDD family membrane protein YckC